MNGEKEKMKDRSNIKYPTCLKYVVFTCMESTCMRDKDETLVISSFRTSLRLMTKLMSPVLYFVSLRHV